MKIAKSVFLLTKSFPAQELYALTAQMRRSAVSVPSNIAEGSQRGSDKEFIRFLRIAKSSLAELETQLLLADAFGYTSPQEIEIILAEIQELSKILRVFIDRIINRLR